MSESTEAMLKLLKEVTRITKLDPNSEEGKRERSALLIALEKDRNARRMEQAGTFLGIASDRPT